MEACGKAGFVPVTVWDGGTYEPQGECHGRNVVPRQLSAAEVIEAVFAVDESTIHFAPAYDLEAWGGLGVFCVGGNGRDFIGDAHVGAKYPAWAKAVDSVDGHAIEELFARHGEVVAAVEQAEADLLLAAERLEDTGYAGNVALAARLRERAGK